MTIQTRMFDRNPFSVEAVQVTPENMEEVATWCGGVLQHLPGKEEGEQGKPYVKVDTHRPHNVRQTQAFVGDWVSSSEAGFKVYTRKAFARAFTEAVVYTEEDAMKHLESDSSTENVFDTSTEAPDDIDTRAQEEARAINELEQPPVDEEKLFLCDGCGEMVDDVDPTEDGMGLVCKKCQATIAGPAFSEHPTLPTGGE